MTRRQISAQDPKRSVQQVASQPWLEPLARFGYAAKGVVYFVVGLLAAQAAIGAGGKTTDSSGALQTIVNQPFGKFLLGIVTVGLIGYALWRFVQAVLDPKHSHEDLDAKQIAQRLGYAFSAIAYTGLAFTAVKLILGSRGSSGDSTQDWTARLLAQPLGQWLVGLGGAIVIGIGISYLYQAYKTKFRQELRWEQMNQAERNWALRLGKFGIGARGIVFGVIGIFLIQAARHSDASEAKGIGGALEALSQQPFGPWILGIVALGLIAYSAYSLIEARYRQIVH